MQGSKRKRGSKHESKCACSRTHVWGIPGTLTPAEGAENEVTALDKYVLSAPA